MRSVKFASILIPLITFGVMPSPAYSNGNANIQLASQTAQNETPIEAPTPKAAEPKLTTPDEDSNVVPLKPRSAREQARVDAVSHFMAGTLHLARNDEQRAYASFQKAVKLSPESVEIYQALIPLAFSLNKEEEGLEYALKAVELDPNDHQLLRALGVHMARGSRVPDAIRFLEKAIASNRLDHKSGVYIRLNRDLAILYEITDQPDKAADAFEIVFNGLESPDEFGLDFQTRAGILADDRSNYEHMGKVFLAAKRPELALKAFEKAQSQQQSRPGVLDYHLAEVYLQTNQPEKSLTALQRYFDAQLQSKGRGAYKLLKQILEQLGQSADLIPRLQKLAEADSRNTTLKIYLADQHLESGQLDDAEAQYKQVLDSGGDLLSYLGLTTVYRKKNDAALLLKNISEALSDAKAPTDLDRTLSALVSEFAEIVKDEALFEKVIAEAQQLIASSDDEKTKTLTHFIMAELSSKAKKTDDAIAHYQVVTETSNLTLLYATYEELGELFVASEQYSNAVEVYKKASTSLRQEVLTKPYLRGLEVNFLYMLSRVQELNHQTEDALTTIRTAQQKFTAPLLFYHEGWIYLHSRNWDKAIETLEKVIKRFPTDTNIVRTCQFSLSNVYVQKGEMRKGEEILEQVLAESPDDPSVNNDLGYLYADQGKNLEQAEAMIRKAVAADPDNPAYLDSLGWVLFKLEKYDEATKHLEKATQQPSGGDATIWSHLGDCYQKLNKKDKATEAWNNALKEANAQSHPDKKIIDELNKKLQSSTP